jgi:hypothetical protein
LNRFDWLRDKKTGYVKMKTVQTICIDLVQHGLHENSWIGCVDRPGNTDGGNTDGIGDKVKRTYFVAIRDVLHPERIELPVHRHVKTVKRISEFDPSAPVIEVYVEIDADDFADFGHTVGAFLCGNVGFTKVLE